MVKKEKLEELDTDALLLKLLSSKIATVDPEAIIYAKQIDTGKDAGTFAILLGGKKLTANQASNLKQEVLMLKNMLLWKVFTETLKHEAQIRMFTKAESQNDIYWGKAILHAISIFETIVRAIENAQIETSPKPLSTPRGK